MCARSPRFAPASRIGRFPELEGFPASSDLLVAYTEWASCSSYRLPALIRKKEKATALRVPVSLGLTAKAGNRHVGQGRAVSVRNPACPSPSQRRIVSASNNPAVGRVANPSRRHVIPLPLFCFRPSLLCDE